MAENEGHFPIGVVERDTGIGRQDLFVIDRRDVQIDRAAQRAGPPEDNPCRTQSCREETIDPPHCTTPSISGEVRLGETGISVGSQPVDDKAYTRSNYQECRDSPRGMFYPIVRFPV